MARYVLLFTTVPDDRIPDEHIVELYRIRWQIELEFKRAKSIANMDKLPVTTPEMIKVWLLAHLVMQLLARQLVLKSSECSEPEQQDVPEQEDCPLSPLSPSKHFSTLDDLPTMTWALFRFSWNSLVGGLFHIPHQLLQTVLKRLRLRMAKYRHRTRPLAIPHICQLFEELHTPLEAYG